MTFHLLNEESRQYFIRMIALSATAQTDYGYIDGDHRCLIRIMAKHYNKSIGDSLDELIEFMKHVTKQQIIDFQDIIGDYQENMMRFVNGVVIESMHI